MPSSAFNFLDKVQSSKGLGFLGPKRLPFSCYHLHCRRLHCSAISQANDGSVKDGTIAPFTQHCHP